MKIIFLPKESARSKQVRKFLGIVIVSQLIIYFLFIGVNIGSSKLGTYIYTQTAKPFLASRVTATHPEKLATTVLLSPSVSALLSEANAEPHSK